MSIDWYLVVSALIFSIGAAGVLTRRNPLVVLLCLELMLNAANIALIAFSRMWNNSAGHARKPRPRTIVPVIGKSRMSQALVCI